MASPIDWNDRGDTFQRATGALHVFQLQRWPAFVLEVSDLHYHTDSAVLLPDAPLDDVIANEVPLAARRTAFAVLAACVRHADAHRTRALLVAGHADTQGAQAYNVTLSHHRAKGVALLLRAQRDPWRTLMRQHHVADDKRLILTWLAVSWGWDCDPRNHPHARCVENLQRAYNDEFGAAIGVDGDWQAETWGAVYDIYQRELAEVLEVDDAGLAALRENLRFVPFDDGVGCGEHFPIDEPLRESYRSATNRRVELVFFEDPQTPEFPCHPAAGRCVPAQCRFYRFHIYDPTLLPVPATPPRLARVPVHLRVTWSDPAGGAHPFPKDTPLKVVFDDGSATDVAVGEDGAVDLFASRRRAWFVLKLPQDGVKYIASAPPGSTEDPPERRVPASGLASVLDLGFRVWRLPSEDIDFSNSDWSATDGSFDAPARRFTVPQAPNGRIGRREARVPCGLDPHWQYVKILYWDRWLKRRLSALPVMLRGFVSDDTTGEPETASNWTTALGCQALPWAHRAVARPDASCMLRFDTVWRTYVYVEGADAASRRLVSTDAAGADPLVSAGAPNTDVPHTSLARMRYYDLPQRWEARGWFCKNASATPPRGRYALLAAGPTTDASPLMFSLDDMVLVDATNAPAAWTPTDRCALFANTFSSGTNLSDVGLYKPDTGNSRSYLTQVPADETDRNYIADYPDWTRVVVAKGAVYAVWDERTRASDPVIGARAAVLRPDPIFPNPTHMPFSADHATDHTYALQHDRNPRPAGHVDVFSAGAAMTYSIGKCQVLILRCCDTRGATTELAAVLVYFPVFYDFNTPAPGYASPSFAPAGATMTANQLQRWRDDASRNIMRRLNGPDGAYNPGRARLLARDPAALPLEFSVTTFLDPVAAMPAPWRVYVAVPAPGNPVRSNMGGGTGLQFVADNTPQASGWFTAAHEFGHAMSRNDEYMERSSSASLYNDGVVEFLTGSPFALDADALMTQNREVRGRYFWHLAEHLRRAHADKDFDVLHGGRTYVQPRHPDLRATFDASPFVVDIDRTHGARGMFSLGLHALGDDAFARTVLPARVGGAAPTDGVLVVVVKIDFQLHTTVFGDMRDIVDAFLARARSAFDQKFLLRGSVGGRTFENCALVFSPRALVSTLPAVPATPNSNAQAYLDAVAGAANSTAATVAPIVTSLRNNWRVHFTVVTHAGNTSAWHATQRRLSLGVGGSWAAEVPELFADMLGVPRASRDSAAAYNALARYVIPDATVRAR